MFLSEIVSTSQRVAATRSRTEKVEALASLLSRAHDDGPRAVLLSTAFLSGQIPHGRLGVGYRSLASVPEPAHRATLTLTDLDGAFATLAAAEGPGSATTRRVTLQTLLGRATADEQAYLRHLVTGAIRQGALDGIMQVAVAAAAEVPLDHVRRAAMLAGRLSDVAVAALEGGSEALAAVTLELLRPVSPMLAASAPDVGAAMTDDTAYLVDCKLDGIRIQAHKAGSAVRLFTRSLDDITERLPEVVDLVTGIPAHSAVLDGEAIAITASGQPEPFQVTGSRTASTKDPATLRIHTPLTTYFFDLLEVDGRVLLDNPLNVRLAELDRLVPTEHRPARILTSDPTEARAFFDTQIARGHEGVVVKRLDAPYAAGRRGSAWVKVKPRHTLDLVVLAVEYGSGRRRGTLSNIHLGARSDDGFVMLGKTFKGMTDEMLAWQTRRFRELATADDGWVVTVRPEQVVEIAFDGLQRSTRYPAGLALRFARVLRYRDDKSADEADTLDTVRQIASRSASG